MPFDFKRPLPAMIAAATLLSVPAAALADTLLVNDVQIGGSTSALEGDTGRATFWLAATKDDGLNGCNASEKSPVVFEVSSSDATKVKFVDGPNLVDEIDIAFTECTDGPTSTAARPVTFKAIDGGASTITARYISGGKDGATTAAAYNVRDSLTVEVTEPVVTAPAIVVPPADTTAPTIIRDSATDSCSLPGDAGWCRGTQSAGFEASDAGGLKERISGASVFELSGTIANFQTSTADNGTSVSIPSGSVTDLAGNTNSGIDATGFMIDSVAPTSQVSAFGASSFVLGSDPTAGCEASDGTSGVKPGADGTATEDRSGLSSNGVGTVSVTCDGAEDTAGNVQAVASDPLTYNLVYGRDGGMLPPINADGSSVFNQKRAVPVKFMLAGDPATGFDVSGWKLRREAQQCGTESWAPEGDASTTSASTGLRYDAAADQYIANATLTGRTVGACYRFVVDLDDGTSIASPKFKVGK